MQPPRRMLLSAAEATAAADATTATPHGPPKPRPPWMQPPRRTPPRPPPRPPPPPTRPPGERGPGCRSHRRRGCHHQGNAAQAAAEAGRDRRNDQGERRAGRSHRRGLHRRRDDRRGGRAVMTWPPAAPTSTSPPPRTTSPPAPTAPSSGSARRRPRHRQRRQERGDHVGDRSRLRHRDARRDARRRRTRVAGQRLEGRRRPSAAVIAQSLGPQRTSPNQTFKAILGAPSGSTRPPGPTAKSARLFKSLLHGRPEGQGGQSRSSTPTRRQMVTNWYARGGRRRVPGPQERRRPVRDAPARLLRRARGGGRRKVALFKLADSPPSPTPKP